MSAPPVTVGAGAVRAETVYEREAVIIALLIPTLSPASAPVMSVAVSAVSLLAGTLMT